MDKQLKAYIAGPDVFRVNPDDHFENVRDICVQYGITPLIPYDNKLQKSDNIYAYNVLLIQNSDVVIANIVPFRGASVDPGTAFEIGYAKAIGKPVIGYSPVCDSKYRERVTEELLDISPDFPYVENFELYDNLMIAHSCDFIYSNLKTALFETVRLYKFLLK